jgi:polar amino acid transport system substrate-binding protein
LRAGNVYEKRAMKSLSGMAIFLVAALGSSCCAAAAQNLVPSPFSQDQVDTGRKNYAPNCAECHGDDLLGVSAPALVGKRFFSSWEQKSTSELYEFIRTTMPLCQAGILGNSAYASLVAYMLWANGAQPGAADFDGKTSVTISTIASGTVRPDLAKSK